jgi:predicted nucleic acid-binding protein
MTAIDTNVMVTLNSQNAAVKTVSKTAFEKAAAAGPICVSGAVFAELLGLPGKDPDSLVQMFESLGISVEWNLNQSDWETAGLAYQGYVRRRRASRGGLPRLMLTDFLIGAHATVRGYSLLTLDKRIYDAAFPGLRIEIF